MESELHGLLKEAICYELKKEGYDLYVEPSESPLEMLSWNYFRPDILGLICQETELGLIIVECETNPSVKRMNEKRLKIERWFHLQKRLNEKHLFRFLLAVPPGMLRKVNTSTIRRLWEIWIVNDKGKIIHKVPKKSIMFL